MNADSRGAHLLRVPSTTYIGEGTYRQVATEAKHLGSRALVVTDLAVGALPETRDIVSMMTEAGLAVTVFDDIPGEPSTLQVDAGLEKLREAGANVVVAIGGGSCIDTAKSVAAMALNPGHLRDYAGFGKLRGGRLPLIAVATTAGTGSEVTSYIAMTDPVANVKMLIGDRCLAPDVAVADPLLTLSCPPSVAAATGLDALTHAIEAYVSRKATPTTDIFALEALTLIAGNLQAAWGSSGDLPAHDAMMRGALYAGIAFSNSSVALVHGMSRPIGAYFHVTHGIANAMLLAEVTRYSAGAAESRYAEIGRRLTGRPDAGHLDTISFVEQLSDTLGIPRLSQGGVDPGRLRELAPQMARDAIASGSPGNNPRVPTEDEIIALYMSCL